MFRVSHDSLELLCSRPTDFAMNESTFSLKLTEHKLKLYLKYWRLDSEGNLFVDANFQHNPSELKLKINFQTILKSSATWVSRNNHPSPTSHHLLSPPEITNSIKIPSTWLSWLSTRLQLPQSSSQLLGYSKRVRSKVSVSSFSLILYKFLLPHLIMNPVADFLILR